MLEARTEEELPEQLLGAFSMDNVDLKHARKMKAVRRRTTVQLSPPKRQSVLGLGFLSNMSDKGVAPSPVGEEEYEYQCVDSTDANGSCAPDSGHDDDDREHSEHDGGGEEDVQSHAGDVQAGAAEARDENALAAEHDSLAGANDDAGAGATHEQLHAEVHRLTARLRAAHALSLIHI